eukprot:TRINITY_DN4549_c0_g1_i2.p1 TRINITY_DN4549_c0_g1~~TRINITY_DN4549_c0_g1_i2.p1  ORF type:complete len:315 (-),score=46.79 TRINITY_DN4549_c0_g1_i2:402-1346(-)
MLLRDREQKAHLRRQQRRAREMRNRLLQKVAERRAEAQERRDRIRAAQKTRGMHHHDEGSASSRAGTPRQQRPRSTSPRSGSPRAMSPRSKSPRSKARPHTAREEKSGSPQRGGARAGAGDSRPKSAPPGKGSNAPRGGPHTPRAQSRAGSHQPRDADDSDKEDPFEQDRQARAERLERQGKREHAATPPPAGARKRGGPRTSRPKSAPPGKEAGRTPASGNPRPQTSHANAGASGDRHHEDPDHLERRVHEQRTETGQYGPDAVYPVDKAIHEDDHEAALSHSVLYKAGVEEHKDSPRSKTTYVLSLSYLYLF